MPTKKSQYTPRKKIQYIPIFLGLWLTLTFWFATKFPEIEDSDLQGDNAKHTVLRKMARETANISPTSPLAQIPFEVMREAWRARSVDLKYDYMDNAFDAIFASISLNSKRDTIAAQSLFEKVTSTAAMTSQIFYSTIGISPKQGLCSSSKCHHLDHFNDGDDFIALTALYDHCNNHPSHTVAFMHNHELELEVRHICYVFICAASTCPGFSGIFPHISSQQIILTWTASRATSALAATARPRWLNHGVERRGTR